MLEQRDVEARYLFTDGNSAACTQAHRLDDTTIRVTSGSWVTSHRPRATRRTLRTHVRPQRGSCGILNSTRRKPSRLMWHQVKQRWRGA
jgi:hypothetical protein